MPTSAGADEGQQTEEAPRRERDVEAGAPRSAPAGGQGPEVDETLIVPSWFGPEDRSLFGWLHVPRRSIGAGVLLCPSIGLEGEASQLAFRSLAPALAAAGCTVLRFDYDGTGDSVGSFTDPDRVESWVVSIRDGLDLLALNGVDRLHVVGMRLGATLAARAVSGDGRVRSLTLWYPWATGRQFLRYQRSLRRLLPFGADSVDG